MASIPAQPATDPTLEAVAAAIEASNRTERPRPYLGMSAIGHDCERFLWLNFRWCGPAGGGFDAESLANFEDGHRTEDVMADRLRMVPGLELFTVDPGTGRQFGFSDHGGHFRGHIDGAVRGLLQAPKTWHVWEHKASGKVGELLRLKAKGEKGALAKWNATYYAQAVLYMHYSQMDRHYATVSAPGGRMPWAGVRTDADPAAAEQLREKALRIITSKEPAARLSDDPAHWKCKRCPMADQCHGTRLPPVSCRTCVHATPELDGDGRWTCAKFGTDLSVADQAKGSECPAHLYVPALLARWGEVVDASDDDGWIEYRTAGGDTFRNGPWSESSFTSRELSACSGPAVLGDAEFLAIRSRYQGRVVEYQQATEQAA